MSFRPRCPSALEVEPTKLAEPAIHLNETGPRWRIAYHKVLLPRLGGSLLPNGYCSFHWGACGGKREQHL